ESPPVTRTASAPGTELRTLAIQPATWRALGGRLSMDAHDESPITASGTTNRFITVRGGIQRSIIRSATPHWQRLLESVLVQNMPVPGLRRSGRFSQERTFHQHLTDRLTLAMTGHGWRTSEPRKTRLRAKNDSSVRCFFDQRGNRIRIGDVDRVV